MKVILNGCNGSMGQVMARVIKRQEDIEVIAGIDKHPEAKSNDFPVYKSFGELNLRGDLIMDFSRPEALGDMLKYAVGTGTPILIATTGHDERAKKSIEEAAEMIPIFMSSNLSLGINLLIKLVKQAAAFLGDAFDIEIIEKHHNKKVDAPSGTAITIARNINEVFDGTKEFAYGRQSKVERRDSKEIGIHAIRGGTIVGEHTVIFAGQDEILEISHHAHSREIFAIGAIKAARFLINQNPGLYGMDDLVNNI
ncbi:MAG: 4-hydroxy-tetrahydrodipicolinate reductase [Firmicutes bacterium]|jgi:4-hydroxy-tetrahydrodipicolinate reductase|nr:4-hydroxy-tetrahydrodipicolinate reductase [Bacillota bacterium]